MFGAGDVRIETIPDACVMEPTDALVAVSRACICGSDLWPYKTMEHSATGRRMGHEAIGVVEAVGADVRTMKAGDLVVMPFAYSDGTLRKPVTIWVVRHGDDLYVRSGYGRTSSWVRGTQERHEGHIRAGGVDKDVLFVEADDDVNDEIDTAYRTKYHRYSARFVTPMVSPEARAATIKLVPGSTSRATGADR
jgi:hypothetical protein